MPGRREYYFKLAVAYCDMPQPDKGVEVLERAIELWPHEAALHYDLAWCAARAARADDRTAADRWAERAIEALNKAAGLDEGFYKRLEQDGDFNHLRDRPGFPKRR